MTTENVKRKPGRPATRKTAEAKRRPQEDVVKSARPKRIPVGTRRDILTIKNKDPRYEYRVVTIEDAKPYRLQEFLDGGYEMVKHDVEIGDKSVRTSDHKDGIAVINVGQGMTGYVMRIKREWYEEDQAEKQKEVNASEADIYASIKEKGRYGTIDID